MSDTTKDRGIGDNSANIKTTDYKGLVHHVIAMLLEPRINIDTYLKDWIERARVATRLADKFEALHMAEELRQGFDDKLGILEAFRNARSNRSYPAAYKWDRLWSQWSKEIHDEYRRELEPYRDNKEEI